MSNRRPYHRHKNQAKSNPRQTFTKLKFDANLLNITYEEARNRLSALLQERSVFEYDSILPSGRITSHYLDLKDSLLSAYGAFLASVCVLNHLKDEIEFVGGSYENSYSLSLAISQLALVRGQEIDTFLVRDEERARRRGNSKWIEGPLRSGAKVCIVHDEVVDGTKIIEIIRKLQDEADTQIVQIISVVDRLDGAKLRLQDYGVDYTSILTMNDIVDHSAMI